MIPKLLPWILLAVLLVAPTPSASLVAPLSRSGRSGILLRQRQRPRPRGVVTRLTAVVGGATGDDANGAACDDNGNVSDSGSGGAVKSKSTPLPPELTTITMGVFCQMLGEGIALSSLPLYLTRLGASPVTVGLAISCFSVAQMTFAPVLVGLSSRIGRGPVLRICLAGAASSSLLIALSGSVHGVIAGRTLAGVFAACVPVAQSGVTDTLPRDQTALGLSRVSAAAQLGVVVGPAASALFQEGFAAAGLPAERCLPAVFVLAAAFAIAVLAQMATLDRRGRRGIPAPVAGGTERPEPVADARKADQPATAGGRPGAPRLAQPMLRTITIIVGWTAILSNSIYGLFAPRYMGFRQAQLSATYSAAAALMVATQMAFPRIVSRIGEHRACMLGILAAGTGIGGQSLLRVQPLHSALYMMNRAGAAVADTATAALVARSSEGREDRSRNLALLTSTRAAARILTPLLSSKMFELSCRGSIAPGALPFVTAACFAMAVAPLPIFLLRAERKMETVHAT